MAHTVRPEPRNPAAGEHPAPPPGPAMHRRPRVALFVTCLVDLFRPGIGFAAVKLLQEAGCAVQVPGAQTCCGQPAYNSGARADTMAIAANTIDVLSGYDYVVAPSGSCAAMISKHYPALFADDAVMAAPARKLAAKTFELSVFLNDVLRANPVLPPPAGTISYLDSCSGLRELGVSAQPRALLRNFSIREAANNETCCGFGGTFCVKYSAISTAMADKKLDALAQTGAQTVLGGDLGCLMHLAGRAARRGLTLRFRHVAEALAGAGDGPAIAEPEA